MGEWKFPQCAKFPGQVNGVRVRESAIELSRARLEGISSPKIALVLFRDVDSSENSSGKMLAAVDSANEKSKALRAAGFSVVGFRPKAPSFGESWSLLSSLANDPEVLGVIVQRPHPQYVFEVPGLATKDLDGNLYSPGATAPFPLATVEVVSRLYATFDGTGAVALAGVRGYIGSRIARELLSADVEVYGLDLGDQVSLSPRVSTVVAATGVPSSVSFAPIGRSQFRLGVDVGNSVSHGVAHGDFTSDLVNSCEVVTPVPGGAGPLEMAVLVERAANRATSV